MSEVSSVARLPARNSRSLRLERGAKGPWALLLLGGSVKEALAEEDSALWTLAPGESRELTSTSKVSSASLITVQSWSDALGAENSLTGRCGGLDTRALTGALYDATMGLAMDVWRVAAQGLI
jgi:hypothetical protein